MANLEERKTAKGSLFSGLMLASFFSQSWRVPFSSGDDFCSCLRTSSIASLLCGKTFRRKAYATAGAPAQTGEMSWRKKPYEEGIANHFDPESCVGLPARAAAKR